jgi:hypothetical protein
MTVLDGQDFHWIPVKNVGGSAFRVAQHCHLAVSMVVSPFGCKHMEFFLPDLSKEIGNRPCCPKPLWCARSYIHNLSNPITISSNSICLPKAVEEEQIT